MQNGEINLLYSTIGQNIAIIRNKQNWTQEDLAEKSNLNVTTIGRIEASNCIYSPSVETLFIIADVLEVMIVSLF